MRREDGGNDGGADKGQTFRTREEFESSLPLFVGGDLEPEDERAVEGWLAKHPGDRELLDSAERARDVLKEHAQQVRSAEVPDLWPGLRRTLGEAGVLPREPEPAQATSLFMWTRGFAAAAAIALATGVGFLMSDAAPPAPDPARSVVGADLSLESDPFGADAEVELVGSPRSGAPLRRPGPDGEHLLDEAPLVPLWQVLPVVQPGASGSGSELASDRR